jgi:iron complex outermembrane receptor protein
VDDHSALPDPIFSPRAALVFKPKENQAFRATFNRAFSTPSSLNQFLDLGSAFPTGNATQAQLALLGYSLRVQGTGQTGFHFQQPDGSYLMRSPFTRDAQGNPIPQTLLPASAAAFFPAAVAVISSQISDPQLRGYLAGLRPTSAEVATFYRDPSTGGSGLLSSLDLPDIDPIRESTTTSLEGGYRGVIGNRLLVAADLWWARKENLVTPLTVSTPLLFLDPSTTAAFLVGKFMTELGMPQAQAVAVATQVTTGLAAVPLGVISTAEVNANGAQLLTTYYNVNDELDYYGADLTATYLLSESFSLGGTLSLVNDNVFETSRGANITLNAPKAKASATGAYRNLDLGLGTELRVRWNDEFPVRSGVYNGTLCIGGTEPGAEECVQSYTLLDVTASYEIPSFRGVALQLSINNLLDEDYRSFPGVPAVGRMAILRAKYSF